MKAMTRKKFSLKPRAPLPAVVYPRKPFLCLSEIAKVSSGLSEMLSLSDM